jgi:hypothetical protein
MSVKRSGKQMSIPYTDEHNGMVGGMDDINGHPISMARWSDRGEEGQTRLLRHRECFRKESMSKGYLDHGSVSFVFSECNSDNKIFDLGMDSDAN